MAEDISLRIIAQGGGRIIEGTVELTSPDCVAPLYTLPAAEAGTLTTRTNDTAGVLTVDGHGVADTDTVNIFWSGGMRYGCDVATTTTDTITFSGGTGDNLPEGETPAITVAPQVALVLGFDGDDLDALVLMASAQAHVDFLDGGDVSLHQQELAADKPVLWHVDSWGANELTGNAVAQILASAGTVADTTLEMIVGWDNTP